MVQTVQGERRGRLCEAMREAGIDAYFASSPITMQYLHGLNEHGAERFLSLGIHSNGEVCLICPSLTKNQASRAGIGDIRAWNDGEDPSQLFGQLAGEWGLKNIVVDDDMPAGMVLRMQAAVPGLNIQTGHATRGLVMRTKDAQELELLSKAGEIADKAYEHIKTFIRAGMTEFDVAKELSRAMADLGGKPSFAIIAAGPNGAEPHHHTDDTVLKDGDVVIMDFGCDYGGYQSDITRTVALGQASEEAKRVYRVVHEAHWAGRRAIAPGIPMQELDRAARSIIAQEGFGDYFTHRLGHGLGMSVHEPPNVVEGETQPLEPGFCFSIEPGIYLPEKFGVRIENIVACTESGHRSFNADPPAELPVL